MLPRVPRLDRLAGFSAPLLLTVLAGLSVLPSGCKKPATEVTSDGGTIAAAAPSGPTTPSFTNDFEGAITMHIVSKRGETMDMAILTKGGKLRIDMPAAHGAQVTHSVFDPKTRQVTVIMDSQKMALVIPIPAAAANAQASTATVTRTGKHEMIAGYDCEDWTIVSENGTHAAACVAKGLAFFDFAASAGPGGGARSWTDDLREKDEFPLRAVELDATGKETSRMEVTKIEKKPVDDALFVIPPGYDSSPIKGMGMQGGGMPHPGHH